MDALTAMKAELERKRKLKAEEMGGKKYAKRSEIEAVRLNKLKEKERENESQARNSQRQKTSHEAEQSTSSAARGSGEQAAVSDAPEEKLSKEEVIRRLRVLGHPATLFGETDEDRRTRLEVAAKNLQIADSTGGQQGHELGHNYIQRMEEQARRAAAFAAQKKEEKLKEKEKEEAEDEKTPEERELEEAFTAAAKEMARQQMSVPERIITFFQKVTADWTEEIQNMTEEYLMSMEGKLLLTTYEITTKNFKPMYKELRKNNLPDDLMRGLYLMVCHMEKRDYRAAMDVYLKMAVGNAPWPIGVTMVGIHERSAREKIFSQTQAHIMHDEASRKFLQSVKRCISFCQRKYPTNPSKSIEFNLRVFGDDLQSLHQAEADGTLVVPEDATAQKDKHGRVMDGWLSHNRDTTTLSAVYNSAYRDGVKVPESRDLVLKPSK
mmetsp:Transcript_41541/g.50357  ORF Transcript_41541/g.50357 Transcript_41541/m.50357 type:complete len:437 (-) Transcript_41541:466-1776(-)|eukprot:CAMPEP_0197863120 /NCGR_PEP_ID=MMETSP1438-20131217/40365_1 /TAXON_ID=1461541 /ORGANISM="Pterosperma sp., Strain CCMP1384" /LENGTH=436 /DNA_ID=CAMNT_0043480901 /DNA_START=190 /DNA_END=1500 /DNA_ORIENTATION=-